MKSIIQKSAIQKKINKNNRTDYLEVIPVAQCKRILILGGVPTRNVINESKALQKNWTEKFNTQIDILLVDFNAKKESANQHADYFLLYKSDFNWKFEPKTDEVSQFFKRKFDLIVDISSQNEDTMAGILAQLHYKCAVRMGKSTYENLHDIVIADQNLTLSDFRASIETYLS